MRPRTLAEAVDRIGAGEPQDVVLAEFVDSFLMAPDAAARYAAIALEPRRSDEPKLDALVGAIGEYLAKLYRLPRVPPWTSEPWRRLEEPWFTTSSQSPGMREYLSFASPAEFRSRNIFTEERPLRRAQPSPIRDRAAPAGARRMIIAIDGPAASGKGTLGKRLAAHYGLRHLDSGLLYRAVAKAVLDAGHALDDVANAVEAARRLDPMRFDEPALKSHALGSAASVVSAIPQVREALLALQRNFAAGPPGAVLDGRDIGTVICPDADAKIFVTATPEVRARRRAAEMRAGGATADDRKVLADILHRDERDSTRSAAPLVRAPDAVLLDTTDLDIEAVVKAAIAIVERARR